MWRKNRKIVRDAGCLTVYNLKKKAKTILFRRKFRRKRRKDIMENIRFEQDKKALFYLEPEAYPGVKRVAEKVAKDFETVCGARIVVTDSAETLRAVRQDAPAKSGQIPVVIAATVGHSACLEEMERQGKIDLARVREKWEVFSLQCVEEPMAGVACALVVAGSDKRGTIYGLFELSEMIGVTPFLYFGDVMPQKYDAVEFPCGRQQEDGKASDLCGTVRRIEHFPMISREPSVRYRGFFINDEWPCFGNWTFRHFGGFNAEMYDHVFEFLLRMKGNYLWPAMWTSSFFLDGPGMASMDLANEYGVIIGNSHHEPCMRASEEWDKVKGENTPYGTAWNYNINKEGLLNYWADGLKRSAGHEKFITIGMRGERDSALQGPASLAENIEVLKDIILEQKKLIRKYVNPDLGKVPMLLAVYKEVEDYYYGDEVTPGLKDWDGLDGVTVMLCEDNFGNMRFLPDERHRDHDGGYGMYYHLDYHGSPVSYEWVGSTPLTRTWEQMTQAWDYGVRQMWMVNVGDLKFEEFFLSYFMRLAYDFETWGTGAPNQTGRYTREFIKAQFPQADKALQERIAEIIEEYVRLNGLRRPEALNDRIYHPAHYLETDRMLERALRLEREDREVRGLLPEKCRDAYDSMIHYPAAGTANLLKMHLYAGQNRLYAEQGKTAANEIAVKVKECIDEDRRLAEEFAGILGGKWSGMEMAEHIGFTKWNSENWKYPVRCFVEAKPEPYLLVGRADETEVHTNDYFRDDVLIRDFMYPGCCHVQIEIANGGSGEIVWRLEGGCSWLSASAVSGRTRTQERITLTFLPEKYDDSVTEGSPCELFVCTEKEKVRILVFAGKQAADGIPEGTCLEGPDGFVIDPARYARKEDGLWKGEKAGYLPLKDYGRYGSGMKVFPTTAVFPEPEKAPFLEYQLFTESAGDYILEIQSASGNPVDEGRGLKLAYSMNGERIRRIDTIPSGYHAGDPACEYWCRGVLNQVHRCRVKVHLREGVNSLRIYAADAPLVLERLLLFPQGNEPKQSYLGPEESFRIGQGDVHL